MSLLNTSRFINLLSTGLLTGILFGDRWGSSPVRPTLSASCFTQFQQGLHVNYVPLMPVLMAISVASGLIAMFLLRRDSRGKDFILTTIGTLCITAVLVLTRVVNVPINNELMTWLVAAPPENWRQLWTPWEQAHTVRTAIAVAGFVCHLTVITVLSRAPIMKRAVIPGAA